MLQGNGYSTGGFGKWHLTPDHVQGMAGPFDRWPNAWGFDHFWGFLSGESGQYDPVITQDNTIIGVPEGKDGAEYYVPDDLTDQAVRWLHAVRAQDADEALVRVLLHGLQPRAASGAGRVERQVQGQVRRRLGRLPRGDLRPPEEARRGPRGRRAHPAARRAPRLGLALRRREEALRPPDGGLRRLLGERRLERRPPARRRRGDGRARRHARHLHLGRQRRQPRGHAHGLVQRADDAQRRPAHARAAALADRPVRRARRLGHRRHGAALRRRLGLGGQLPLPVGQAGRQPPRRHAQRHGRLLAAAHQEPDRRCAASSRTSSTSGRRSSKPPASRRPRSSTASRRRRWRARASSTPSTTRARPSATRSSTSRSSATGPSTRTAGGRAPSSTASRGTSRRRRMARFAPDKYDPENDIWELYYLPDDFSQAKDLAAEHPEKLAELKQLFWEEAEKHKVLPLLAGFSVFFGILPPMPTDTKHTFYGDVENVLAGHGPADLRPLLRDHGRPPHARGRRRRRDRGRGGRDGRLLPVRPGRQAPAHVQHAGRRGLPAGVRRSRCPTATSASACSSTPTRPSPAPAAT